MYMTIIKYILDKYTILVLLILAVLSSLQPKHVSKHGPRYASTVQRVSQSTGQAAQPHERMVQHYQSILERVIVHNTILLMALATNTECWIHEQYLSQ